MKPWARENCSGCGSSPIFVGLTMNALSICIMLVIYGRMIEVYLTTSVGPIPLATMTNRDWSHTGQNYLKSLFALAFQAFLIMVCVGIYSDFGTEYRHGRKYLRCDMGLHGLHGPAVLRPVQDRQPL